MIEELESRRMFNISVQVVSNASDMENILYVNGDSGDNQITVVLNGDLLTLEVYEGPNAIARGSETRYPPEELRAIFEPFFITRIVINGGNGDDQIVLRGDSQWWQIPPAAISGGNGSDTVWSEGRDVSIDGGNGDDTIYARPIWALESTVTVIPSNGHDVLYDPSPI